MAVLAPATSFGSSKSGEFTNWSTPPLMVKKGGVGASQVPADRVPLGVGPDVGGHGRRIRRAVFTDLGVVRLSHWGRVDVGIRDVDVGIP